MRDELLTRNLLLNGTDESAMRAQIKSYFLKTYEIYERLFDLLKDDAVFYERPELLRHPLIFYFGHTACFYINKLVLAKKIERINPRFEVLFAIGVDEMSWDDLNQDRYDWPRIEAVREYRLMVKEVVCAFIDSTPLSFPVGWESPFWAVMMGIEHERIHLETSSVLLRQLDISFIRPNPLFPICEQSGSTPHNRLIPVSGGHIHRNRQIDSDALYGWDNEYGSFEADVAPFAASEFLVSNGEFLSFVEDGGYQSPEFWDDEGQRWLSYTKRTHPVFWIPTHDGYTYRTLSSVINLPLDWPVDVNYLEAKAFCRWLSKKCAKSIRMPSEAEYMQLLKVSGVVDEPFFGQKAPANINLEYYASAVPVTRFKHGDFYDVVGNVWQWSETTMFPFEGFKTHPLYDDFTVPTFDGRHNLIKGGSFISTGNEALQSARYAFRRHFFQHAGFRYVESNEEVAHMQNTIGEYKQDSEISESLEFHYGDDYFGVQNFPARIARIAILSSGGGRQKRALDLGCGVGRGSFELAKIFDEVTAIDFSARFIDIASAIQTSGELEYTVKKEGDGIEKRHLCTAEFDCDAKSRANIAFWQGDACNLKPHFTGYDVIVAANILDKIYDPKLFLSHIHERLEDNGIFVLASAYDWKESVSAKDKWLGGIQDGEAIFDAFDTIEDILTKHFVQVGECLNVEFVRRHSERLFTHGVSEVSIWKKK